MVEACADAHHGDDRATRSGRITVAYPRFPSAAIHSNLLALLVVLA
jgi:hypothetical protein